MTADVSTDSAVRVVSLNDLLAAFVARRRDLGISQDELADRLGTSQSAISLWEIGRIKPNGTSVFAIAAALDCDLALVPRGEVR